MKSVKDMKKKLKTGTKEQRCRGTKGNKIRCKGAEMQRHKEKI